MTERLFYCIGLSLALFVTISGCSTPIYDEVDAIRYQTCLDTFNDPSIAESQCQGFRPKPIAQRVSYEMPELVEYKKCLKERGWVFEMIEYLGQCKRPIPKA